jgi:hypothetical protein
MSATLNYAPGGAAGQIVFDLTAYQRRSEWSPAPNLGDIVDEGGGGVRMFFGDGSSTPLLRFKVIAVDLANDMVTTQALAPGSNTVTSISHTYANTNITYDAFALGCCRTYQDIQQNRCTTVPKGQTGGETSMNLSTRVVFNNSNPVVTGMLNSSSANPQFPIVQICEGSTASFSVVATDPNGDNMTYRLASNMESCNDATKSGPTAMTINPTTGVVSWNTTGLTQVKYWSVQIIIEDRTPAGALKSWTPVDFLLKIVPCGGGGVQEIPGGSLSSSFCWPPNHKLVNISANLTLGAGYTQAKLISIICNELDNGLGDGNTINDIQGAAYGTDDRQFQLRCERSGKGSGRIYNVTYEFTGPNMTPMQTVFAYVVPHDQGNKKMAIGSSPEIAASMVLYPSAPNPFTGSTKITYTLKQSLSSALKIYNVTGEEIKTLHSGLQDAGTYSLTWDGRDNNGSDVPSGTYFYKLEAPECGCGTVMEMQLQR